MTPHRWLIPVLGIVFGVIGHSLSTDSPGGVFCSADAFAADHKTDVAISYYRKEGGNTVDDGQSLPSSFDSKEGYLWRTPLASGHSTPCFAGDRIFLTTSRGEELATVSLYRDTGEVRWKRALPTTKLEEIHGSGSRATCSPASDGERLYVFFGSYGLVCYDLDGQHLWEKRMGPFQDQFGANSSPIIVEDKVILNQDHDVDSFLMALDKRSGDVVWTTMREGFTRSYSTPVIWETAGKRHLVVAGALQLVGYDVGSGKKVWWVNGLARIVNPTPAISGKYLFAAGWTPGGDLEERISMESFSEAVKSYDKNNDSKIAESELTPGPVLTRFFRIDLNQDGGLDEEEWNAHAGVFDKAQNCIMAVKSPGDARGDLTATHIVWQYRRALPNVPSPLLYRDVVYTVKNSGIVTSLNPETGERLKQGRASGLGNYYASPVAGDGKVYMASEPGVITILKAGGNWEIVSYHDFGERIMATPVIRRGRIYIRTDDALYCFGQ